MQIDEAAAGFAAMGAGPRLTVLRVLVRVGDDGGSVGRLQAATGLAPSTLAHHLRALVAAGLVAQDRQGRETLNRARFDRLEALASFILAECCIDSAATADTASSHV